MNDQLIDKLADAILISMVKRGALASPDNWTVKQAAVIGPGSWIAAGMQAMRNGLTPAQLAQLKRNTGRGAMIGAGIGTTLGMIRGARQTAQQAGGWRNASFGQYAKNMIGQGAMGGIGGGVAGAGAGAAGTYGKNIYQGASAIHANDLKDMAAAHAMQNLGNKAQAKGDMVQKGQKILQNSVKKNQETIADTKADRGFFSRLFSLGRDARTIGNAQGEIEGATKALNKLEKGIGQSAARYQNEFNTEMGNLQGYMKNRNVASNMTTLPANYFQNVMGNAQQNINNLRNIKHVQLPGAIQMESIRQRDYS